MKGTACTAVWQTMADGEKGRKKGKVTEDTTVKWIVVFLEPHSVQTTVFFQLAIYFNSIKNKSSIADN